MPVLKSLSRLAWLLWLAVCAAFLCLPPASAGHRYARKQIPTPPALARLAPAHIDAGAPAFTLTLYGSAFPTDALVRWSAASQTSTLNTTVVSSTQLQASVPASLISKAGSASLSVFSPSLGASVSKSFTILLTSLAWKIAMSYNTGGEYTALLHITNTGYRTAENITLTGSTLGAAASTCGLPMAVGSLAPGATLVTDLTYSASAGNAGEIVSLKIAGYFTGLSFNQIQRVTLP